MEQGELDNLNKVEMIEEIKGRCKSRLKSDLYHGMFVLPILIALCLLVLVQIPHPYSIGAYLEVCVYVFWACVGVWSILFTYRLYKRITVLDTPEGLLFWYEKRMRNDRVFRFLVLAGMLVCMLGGLLNAGCDLGLLITLIMLSVVMLVVGYYFIFIQSTDNVKDKEIVEDLKDLADAS